MNEKFTSKVLSYEVGTVWVFLPVMNENFRALRVLVIEDELLIRWSIAETLAHAGHTVIEAADGATAIRALENDARRINAVVLDYRLPDSDDLTLLQSGQLSQLVAAGPGGPRKGMKIVDSAE